MKQQSIFRVGDRVYDARGGWGEVAHISKEHEVPSHLTVHLDSGLDDFFTKDGKHNPSDLTPSLSFTEYDFIKGGFSQERPLPDINRGDLVYVMHDSPNATWQMRFFSHFKDGKAHCYLHQVNYGPTLDYDFVETENPLLK